LKYGENEDFFQRCLELWQVLYKNPFVDWNEVPFFLARGAYAEIKLHKEVDWNTIKEKLYIVVLDIGNIPRGVLPFPKGGLELVRCVYRIQDPTEVDTTKFEEDDDSNGT